MTARHDYNWQTRSEVGKLLKLIFNANVRASKWIPKRISCVCNSVTDILQTGIQIIMKFLILKKRHISRTGKLSTNNCHSRQQNT